MRFRAENKRHRPDLSSRIYPSDRSAKPRHRSSLAIDGPDSEVRQKGAKSDSNQRKNRTKELRFHNSLCYGKLGDRLLAAQPIWLFGNGTAVPSVDQPRRSRSLTGRATFRGRALSKTSREAKSSETARIAGPYGLMVDRGCLLELSEVLTDEL